MLRREALEGGSMRKATVRNVLLRIGIAALVLVAATGPTLAKKARASAYANTTSLLITTLCAIGSDATEFMRLRVRQSDHTATPV